MSCAAAAPDRSCTRQPAELFNEIHPGSFALMDVNYARNEHDPAGPNFEFAMFVLTCVMSVGEARATLDAGLKAFSTDCGPPRPTFPG